MPFLKERREKVAEKRRAKARKQREALEARYAKMATSEREAKQAQAREQAAADARRDDTDTPPTFDEWQARERRNKAITALTMAKLDHIVTIDANGDVVEPRPKADKAKKDCDMACEIGKAPPAVERVERKWWRIW